MQEKGRELAISKSQGIGHRQRRRQRQAREGGPVLDIGHRYHGELSSSRNITHLMSLAASCDIWGIFERGELLQGDNAHQSKGLLDVEHKFGHWLAIVIISRPREKQ